MALKRSVILPTLCSFQQDTLIGARAIVMMKPTTRFGLDIDERDCGPPHRPLSKWTIADRSEWSTS